MPRNTPAGELSRVFWLVALRETAHLQELWGVLGRRYQKVYNITGLEVVLGDLGGSSRKKGLALD